MSISRRNELDSMKGECLYDVGLDGVRDSPVADTESALLVGPHCVHVASV